MIDLTFKNKRDSLELFVKEQIIGPGAFNKRFFLLDKWPINEFAGIDLKSVSALQNVSEVLSEVPAYQYSSAILFPISKTVDGAKPEKVSDYEDDTSEGVENEIISSLDDDNLRNESAESVSSKNQNYPNTCGIAFAIKTDTNMSDLSLHIKFRTYKKISQSKCRDQRLGYWISENIEILKNVFNEFYSDVFQLEDFDGNAFVFLKKDIDINEQLYTLDYVNFEKFTVKMLIPLIDKFFSDKPYYVLSKSNFNNTDFEYTKIYEESLYESIADRLKDNSDNYSSLSKLIEVLEVYNQIKNIVNELKTIYRKSSQKNKPTPIWESTLHSKIVNLPENIQNAKTVRNKFNIDIEGIENLIISYQYIDYGSKGTYVKLILVNENEIKIKATEPPQLNKKDEANEKSFFGVEMRVAELKSNILKPYNPPNLIEIDEEDSFNKIIYRQYKDYGEGYNTSVTWGIETEDLKFVSSEFMPEQETPKVDFQPSKIDGSGDKIIYRINDNVLSMRELSTLSSLKNEEIVSRLDKFISEYVKWIEEKKELLANGSFDSNSLDILTRQLKGCENDANRLSRNIKLLERDTKAMSAFRIMNTAMFMQLHHSIEVKKVLKDSSSPFIPSGDQGLEDYYKKLLLKDDYKWRSFQLAFVILNIDAFVKPREEDTTVKDIFKTGWPERNEIADLVWFPTGGGKTEAYLGIIAFTVAYRRFTQGKKGYGTTALMRYTLRLLTLQQFQRATLLICALEVIRKDKFHVTNNFSLGDERISIGLFVGGTSLPNKWDDSENSMVKELEKITEHVKNNRTVETNIPHTNCPWCGGPLFINKNLPNLHPNLIAKNNYKKDTLFKIMCNSIGCTFNSSIITNENSLPLRLIDEDIYKSPPTLLFGTVDKFAALANKVSKEINQDSRRLVGKRNTEKGKINVNPPELIIQDELHLLLGPLGSAVGLFEKSIDMLCSYENESGMTVKPKIITSTATTRNTDKQIFALFNRRSEIFPKQGIDCDDSFFAYYQRKIDNVHNYDSDRKYIGLLPVGKTQVWMQLRLASISLSHRLKFLKDSFTKSDIFENNESFKRYEKAFDFYHTVLSYFNSLKEVGKTQSQLSHYLPGDLNLIIKNTMPWNFLSKMIKSKSEIQYSELTGRLTGEEVKTNLFEIERNWNVKNRKNPPEFIIATNMISVGIDVGRFNTMIINSMPRNTAEYIQASSRVAREKEGIVFTIHHPFRSRDISHYQRFKEYHEKFYSYVEPISVTPFADKALERYFAMFLAVLIRHDENLPLSLNDNAININNTYISEIKKKVLAEIGRIRDNSINLNEHLKNRDDGLQLNINGIIDIHEFVEIEKKVDELLIYRWLNRILDNPSNSLKYRDESVSNISLFYPRNGFSNDNNWNVKQSLREIAPSVVIKIVQQ